MSALDTHKDLIEVIDFACTLVFETFKSLEDGEISFSDFTSLLAIYNKLDPALDDIGKAQVSLKNLTVTEADEINSYFKDKFDIPNDQIEAYIELGVDIGVSLAKAFNLIKKEA